MSPIDQKEFDPNETFTSRKQTKVQEAHKVRFRAEIPESTIAMANAKNASHDDMPKSYHKSRWI